MKAIGDIQTANKINNVQSDEKKAENYSQNTLK